MPMLNHHSPRFLINIFSDSRSVLSSLTHTKIKTSTINTLVHHLNVVGQSHHVHLHWVPGHQNIKGNEEADHLARSNHETLAQYNNISYSSPNILPPLSHVKRKLKLLKKIAIKNIASQSNATNKLKSFIHLIANSKTLPKLFKTSNTNTIRLDFSLMYYQVIPIWTHSSLKSTKTSLHFAHAVSWNRRLLLIFFVLAPSLLFYVNPYSVTH